MKRRIFAALLGAAMVLSLTACGGNNNSGGSSSSNPGSSSANGSGVSSSQPDASTPDASDPSGSGSAGGSASSSEGLKVTITLNKTDIKLNTLGATFQLRYTAEPDTDGIPSFTSSDPKVATVDESGTITAMAPGKATITVTYDGATATASVNCSGNVNPPAPDTSKPDGSGSGSSSAAKVDLQKFYDDTTGKYEFGFLELADPSVKESKEILDMLYPGLSDVSAEQMLVYVCMMSMNNGEFCLVQVKDSKDVDTVKAIFQARIDYMVGDGNGPGGAQYPMAMDQWENFSRIVTNGNYVMMVVHEKCDDIVSEFNALF